jgi:hypothetical protein
MQRPVDDRVLDRTAHGGFIGRLHGSHDQYAPGLGLFEKRQQPLLLLLDREVLVMATTRRFVLQYGLPLPKIVRMHLSHGTDLPT